MSIKQSWLVKKAYKIPGATSAYHFLWAWTGRVVNRYPRNRIFTIGITGTKGKTTTVELLNAILEAAGKRTALLSSVRMKIGESSEKNPTGNSMPGHGYIQRFLRAASRDRCNYALIEVTSQGIALHRHRFVNWNIGAITNLSPEHIESHGSFENYRKAKFSFLRYVLQRGGKVFLNRDDPSFSFFNDALKGDKTIECSKTDLWLKEYLPKVSPMRLTQDTNTTQRKFLVHGFNEGNIAVAVAIAKDLGINDRIIEQGIMGFQGVPGRMEFVRENGYTGIVDYAHTPDSLEAAYKAARQVMENSRIPIIELQKSDLRAPKLICVLGGTGGGRDTWKRPEMGKIAAQYCDQIILTDEDSYDEDTEKILDQIQEGIESVPHPRAEFMRILDRRAAIQKAVDMMEEGDVVIGTGKGSEDWIHIANGKKIPWSEKAVFEEMLKNKNRPNP